MRIIAEVLRRHPDTIFGLMAVNGLDCAPERNAWNNLKAEETEALRAAWGGLGLKDVASKSPISSYVGYYKQFKKTYPVLLQMESVLIKGRNIQSSTLAVETMFLAEVKHGLLVGGHDQAALGGDYSLNLAKGGESFTSVAGQDRSLKADDIFMADGGRILSTVLEGQDYHSRLTDKSSGALYCVYGLGGVSADQMEAFFQDLTRYTLAAFPLASVQKGQVFTAHSQ